MPSLYPIAKCPPVGHKASLFTVNILLNTASRLSHRLSESSKHILSPSASAVCRVTQDLSAHYVFSRITEICGQVLFHGSTRERPRYPLHEAMPLP